MKLSKEKKSHILLVGIVTAAVMAGIGFGLVRNQYDGLAASDAKHADLKKKLGEMNDAIRRKSQTEKAVEVAISKLEERETGMARGDIFTWFIGVVGRYKTGYKIEIPQVSPATPEASCNLIPKFAYKQSTVTIQGSGYYHDIGRFIAEFENDYPYARIVNLVLEPNPTAAPNEREKLSFNLSIVALVKPKS